MRFTGQLKIPDLDHPGVPAEVLLEGKQTELLVEGESLGRWSLVDVRAERLIANAFSLDLDGEEVTFIADEPTEFAYGGVDEMAKVWARHRAKRLPVRLVANSRSRKGTKPSRLDDLRDAIVETMTAPHSGSPSGLHQQPATTRSAPEPPPRPESRGARYAPSRSVIPDQEDPAPTRADEAASAPAASAPAAEAPPSPEKLEERAVTAETDDAITQEGADPAADSVFKSSVPWAKQSTPDERAEDPAEDSVEGRPTEPTTTPESVTRPQPEEPAAVQSETPDAIFQPEEPVSEQPAEPRREQPAGEPSVPWIAPPQPAASRESDEREPPRSPEPPREDAPTYVVDLGAFEDDEGRSEDTPGHDVSPGPEPARAPEPEPEPALAAAPEKSGLLGAVRSAFVRNTVEHTHEFVEAPGGLGIVRQICAECGHISIGVNE